jgi:thioredoxin-related protein
MKKEMKKQKTLKERIKAALQEYKIVKEPEKPKRGHARNRRF